MTANVNSQWVIEIIDLRTREATDRIPCGEDEGAARGRYEALCGEAAKAGGGYRLVRPDGRWLHEYSVNLPEERTK